MDDRVPERRDSHASFSHEPSLEPTPTTSANLGKHSVYSHFPQDRNCEICQRTKITRAPCRRCNGGVVPRKGLKRMRHNRVSDTRREDIICRMGTSSIMRGNAGAVEVAKGLVD